MQISSGFERSNSNLNDISFKGSSTRYTRSGVSDNYVPVNLGVGYTKSISDKFTLGALVEYNPETTNLGVSQQFFAGAYQSTADCSVKIHDQLRFSLVPGYKLNGKNLVYMKLSYVVSDVDQSPNDGAATTSRRLNGWGGGLGYKYLLTQNWQVFAEANYAKYSNKTSVVASSPSFSNTASLHHSDMLLGVGYKF